MPLRRPCFLLAAAALAACETVPVEPGSAPGGGTFRFADYRGGPEIVRDGNGGEEAVGVVFEDRNRNSRRDEGEPGIRGVKVSNGRDVVVTGADGSYAIPALDDMSLFVVQPAGYQVPHDTSWVPQFSYEHKPGGSPKPLRFGGLEPTGPLPSAINFPLIRTGAQASYRCAVLGDPQTYANQEIGYFRDSTVDDILDRGEAERPACVLGLGDMVGDDLGLIPRLAEVIGMLEAPQWWVHGNHDIDFDADYDRDSADSWRTLWGPNNYAFEIGEVLYVVLDNVFYPCTAEDAARPGRAFCTEDERKRYNARLTEDQLAFVEGLLANTDEDKLVVFAHHIPFVSFVDQTATAHQTDNVAELYRLAEGRKALSFSGHTHTTENFAPGDSFAGWQEAIGVEAVPFRHIIAGAASGGWYHGDFDHHGVPMALQRMGSPMGWLSFDVSGSSYRERYHGANTGHDRRMWLSVNTPVFRSWYGQIMDWRSRPEDQRDPVPPLSINDLPDVKIMTPRDLSRGTWLTANIWDGDSATRAEAVVDGRTLTMERTQSASGEEAKAGAEWADPFAVQRQLSVSRSALESRSGIPRNQGYEAYRGSSFGPQTPGPTGPVADRNMHLWRARLPEDLAPGLHRVVVRSTDRHGQVTEDSLVLEVRDRQPPPRFRTDVFDAREDGPPVR
ncbi:calcineurin-like phosphoesterase C-terminal domain-containing protein [Parvularcula maris]|uniref:Calcineurin-like phosphoesterase family protein n=1 Tax=Parvularcula maris TaxID=2965077 RepID=A0A9X2LA14_9PROT|nr:calcineurin-like phosphoesterase family protein [Parvularcula maris]MCQ8185802.1 calcineurin-like phosphoesterase family protein [Parvularcula maris]